VDAGASDAPEQVTAMDRHSFSKVRSHGLEVDVTRDYGAGTVADPHIAPGGPATVLVELDALDDTVVDRDDGLTERVAKIDTAVAELAFARARLGTASAEAP
jgi:hypothetical protein